MHTYAHPKATVDTAVTASSANLVSSGAVHTYAHPKATVDTTVTAGSANLVSSGAVHTSLNALTKADVGLSNVDNTSDAAKPISTATQNALDMKLDITALDQVPSRTWDPDTVNCSSFDGVFTHDLDVSNGFTATDTVVHHCTVTDDWVSYFADGDNKGTLAREPLVPDSNHYSRCLTNTIPNSDVQFHAGMRLKVSGIAGPAANNQFALYYAYHKHSYKYKARPAGLNEGEIKPWVLVFKGYFTSLPADAPTNVITVNSTVLSLPLCDKLNDYAPWYIQQTALRGQPNAPPVPHHPSGGRYVGTELVTSGWTSQDLSGWVTTASNYKAVTVGADSPLSPLLHVLTDARGIRCSTFEGDDGSNWTHDLRYAALKFTNPPDRNGYYDVSGSDDNWRLTYSENQTDDVLRASIDSVGAGDVLDFSGKLYTTVGANMIAAMELRKSETFDTNDSTGSGDGIMNLREIQVWYWADGLHTTVTRHDMDVNTSATGARSIINAAAASEGGTVRLVTGGTHSGSVTNLINSSVTNDFDWHSTPQFTSGTTRALRTGGGYAALPVVRVTFDKPIPVDRILSVVIWNRTSCCWGRLGNDVVRLIGMDGRVVHETTLANFNDTDATHAGANSVTNNEYTHGVDVVNLGKKPYVVRVDYQDLYADKWYRFDGVAPPLSRNNEILTYNDGATFNHKISNYFPAIGSAEKQLVVHRAYLTTDPVEYRIELYRKTGTGRVLCESRTASGFSTVPILGDTSVAVSRSTDGSVEMVTCDMKFKVETAADYEAVWAVKHAGRSSDRKLAIGAKGMTSYVRMDQHTA